MPRVFRRYGDLQGICGCVPLAGALLPGEHKPGRVSAGEPRDESGQVLAPSSLRISNLFHGIGKLAALHRSFAVVLPPGAEDLGYALAFGVLSLEDFDPFNGIPAAKGKESVSAPLRPCLEAS
jgi:hypothetical protein